MIRKRVPTTVLSLLLAALALPLALVAASQPQQAEGTSQTASRRIGAIKAINGSTITLSIDSGPEIAVAVQPNARILRVAPGEKDLKSATPITIQDLQVNDRVMVGGKASDDGKAMTASAVLVMKRSDVDTQQQKNLEDWKKRGIDGVVKSVDPTAGKITISMPSFGGAKEIAIQTSTGTVIRRYAPGSANFADAKPGTLAEIQKNDQLRARGNRSPDGSEVSAEEIVSGSFRNISGTVDSVDTAAGTITVHDLSTKKAVEVKITPDSLLRKLPAEVARVAVAMKGVAPDRLLSRMPVVGLSDLQKGDVVMIVATEATATSDSIVTKLLSGAEPLLRATPSASQTLMLTPWNLGTPSGDSGN